MKIAGLNIKPIAIHLPDEEKWVKRYEDAKAHFEEQGVDEIFWLTGIHGKKFQIKGTGIYLLDGKPEEKFYVGDANVANSLTQYCAFVVMDALDHDFYLYLEDDCRFSEGWKLILEQALLDAGTDWDIMFVGHCCVKGKRQVHIKGSVFEFPYRGKQNWGCYPMATHCYIINKRCVKHLIATNRDTSNPSDVSLVYHSFPSLRVLAVIPRLAEQHNTFLSE